LAPICENIPLPRRSVLLLALALGAACAHRAPSQKVELDPIVITAGRERSELEAKTDGQLFDDGTVFLRAGKAAEAAQHFDRLVTAYPDSPQILPALFNAGLAHQRLGQFAEALDRFNELLRRDPKGRDAVDAQLQAAISEHRLGKKKEAADRLHALGARTDLGLERRGEALVQEGVWRVELGSRADAEQALREAIRILDSRDATYGIDPSLPAKAEFWLGELQRGEFSDIKLDPATMSPEKLEDEMESKAKRLLGAQEQYVRAMRRGDADWATAAALRVGELYETFHDELLRAPLPKGLDAGQARVYRSELRERVRVLLGKAIRLYEDTLSTALRVGARSDYVERARQSLDRVKKLLSDDAPSL
jgi:tetratricopeptide (TPR) repeat protein